MVKQHGILDWRSLGIAISLGIFSLAQTPARAFPAASQSSFELAQVGVGSRIDRPTPLNLRPRTHIPLPTVNGRSGSYYRYSDRDRYYDRYQYGHEHYHTHRRRNRHRKGPVIIINPANSYSNYDYIRVIRK